MTTITEAFLPYIGTREYNGIVAEIQRWFYGSLVKASWCATSVSYFANQIGILDQLGGKSENVYEMMRATEKAHKALKKGTFLYRDDIKTGMEIPRGTIVFMLYSSKPMTSTSSKHVTSVYETFSWSPSGKFKALGGNQSDGINLKEYNRGNIYAIFIPQYEEERHKTLRCVDKGDDVVELQIDLNNLGYPDDSYNALSIDGSYGPRTEQAVKRLQAHNGLVVDGICGPKTWAKIEELLNADPKYVIIRTDIYLRTGPGKTYDTKGILREGAVVNYSFAEKGWLYLPRWNGWISSKKEYVKIV